MDTNQNKKVLIIDDEEDLNEVLKEKLARENFQVFVAFNGEDGMRIAFEEQPDIILLDIIMPDMNGLVLLERLQEYRWDNEPKVIMLSALGHEEKKEQALALGAIDYFVKTEVTVEDITQKIKQVLCGEVGGAQGDKNT